LKFKRDLAAGVLLGRLLAHRLPAGVELIVPIPLSRRRQAARGYNQAVELAIPVHRRLGIAIDPHALRRARDTPPQLGLSASARRLNVRGAFVGDPARLAGRHVALLDDVMTTGATLTAATRAVRAAGARSVSVWVVARAG